MEPLNVGDLVTAYVGPDPAIRKNYHKHHGFGVVVEITPSKPGGTALRYTVKFTKSNRVVVFMRDGIEKYE